MPTNHDVTPDDTQDKVTAAMMRPWTLADVVRLLHHRQDLMLAVSVVAGLNLVLAFAPNDLRAYVAATVAGIVLWTATLLFARADTKSHPERIGVRAIPTYTGLITFTVRLVIEAPHHYTLWIIGSLEVLYILRMLYRATARVARSTAAAGTEATVTSVKLRRAA